MKILSITSSTPVCGVAILDNLDLVKEISVNEGLTHSEQLMPIIKQILLETDLSLNNIDLICTDIGPGSFTGIRIGVATAKAFFDSLNIKCIGVTSLQALSLNYKSPGIICCLIDAKKNNVYNQLFEITPYQSFTKRNASFDNIDSLLLEFKNINPEYNITFIGDGAKIHKDKILNTLPNSKFIKENSVSAHNIGYYGFSLFHIGEMQSIEPFYLRKTDAEENNI